MDPTEWAELMRHLGALPSVAELTREASDWAGDAERCAARPGAAHGAYTDYRPEPYAGG